MLGFLYTDSGNRSPTGQAYDGLTGEEGNPDDLGQQVKVYKIQASDPDPYLMPGADPGEGFQNTNYQLYSNDDPQPGAMPDNKGFILNFQSAIASDLAKHYSDTLPGTQPSQIMGMYTPELLPIMSGSPKGLPSATPSSPRSRRRPSRTGLLHWLGPRKGISMTIPGLHLPQHLWPVVGRQLPTCASGMRRLWARSVGFPAQPSDRAPRRAGARPPLGRRGFGGDLLPRKSIGSATPRRRSLRRISAAATSPGLL
jgi:hypothetical protein